MIRMVQFIQKTEDFNFLLLRGSGQIFGLVVRFYFNLFYFISMVISFKIWQIIIFFFKVLAELGYFKCFLSFIYFSTKWGGGWGFVRPLVENSTIYFLIFFETLPQAALVCKYIQSSLCYQLFFTCQTVQCAAIKSLNQYAWFHFGTETQ